MLKTSESPEAFSEAFQSRLQSMGRMHDLLSQTGWHGAALGALVAAAVLPLVGTERPNVSYSGPDIVLTASASAPIGMVLHELATNAAKHGALSTPGGGIEVSWRMELASDGNRLHFGWHEHGAAGTGKAEHHGFGLSFVRRTIEYELQGTVQLGFSPDGFYAELSIPLQLNVLTA
jgi:two-component sensor histidine kinase